ncbi:MAG TPA: dienelactone hydrolase family protein, partial [Thermoanaerobaculia bacterium]|nr:dienelactone hydrolase family protein [Thermoanaerobaculia bacterium]
MIHNRLTLQSGLGQPIHLDLRLPECPGPHPVVVVCHGFKGFKDWGFHPWLGERLAAAGLAALHFNFSRNGVRTPDGDIEDLDAFRKNTLSIEREDLDTVLDAVLAGRFDAPLDPSRLGLMGHSRGGGIALLGAAERLEVKALVTWAAVSHFDRIADQATLAEWRRSGVYEVLNARTGQILPMGLDFLDDILGNRARLDLLAAARRLRSPWLVVHGSADETVPFAEAEELVAACGGRCRLAAIDGAGHTFGAVHPFAGPTPHLEAAAAATLDHLLTAAGFAT